MQIVKDSAAIRLGVRRYEQRSQVQRDVEGVCTLGVLRRNVVFLLFGALAVPALAGCGGSGTTAPSTVPPDTVATLKPTANLEVYLTQQDNRVEAPVGILEKLFITLPAKNGAVWTLAYPVGPELKQLQAPASAAGTQTLAFQAVKTGTVTVELNSSKGGQWYAVILVWAIHLSPKNFVPPGAPETSPKH